MSEHPLDYRNDGVQVLSNILRKENFVTNNEKMAEFLWDIKPLERQWMIDNRPKDERKLERGEMWFYWNVVSMHGESKRGRSIKQYDNKKNAYTQNKKEA